MAELDDPRAGFGAAPIEGENPAGDNARYEPEFDALEAEISKGDMQGPAAVDWKFVSKTSLDLISTKSKDLLIGGYATYGLFRTEGYPGLAVGLTVLADMIDTHWDGLTPPLRRERARVQAVEWLSERLAPMVLEARPGDNDGSAVEIAFAAISRMSDLLDEKLEKNQASVGELLRPLREYAREAERAAEAERVAEEKRAAEAEAQAATEAAGDGEPAAEGGSAQAATQPGGERGQALLAEAASAGAVGGASTSASAGTAAPAAAPTAAQAQARPAAAPTAATVAAPTAGANEAQVNAALRQLRTNMLDFAKALRAADSSDPRAYLLVRNANSLALRRLPETNNNQIDVPPPNEDDLLAVTSRLARGAALEALEMGEPMLGRSPFWLDGHKLMADALEAMGPTHEAAHRVACGAAALVAQRLPELLDLSYSTGAALADNDTRSWFAGLSSGGGGAAAQAEEELALEEARKRARAGDAAGGAALLARGGGGGERNRVLWQMARARFCLDTQNARAAVAILQATDQDLSRSGGVEFDPELSARVLKLLLQARATLVTPPDDTDFQTETQRLRDKLSTLDLQAAMEFFKT